MPKPVDANGGSFEPRGRKGKAFHKEKVKQNKSKKQLVRSLDSNKIRSKVGRAHGDGFADGDKLGSHQAKSHPRVVDRLGKKKHNKKQKYRSRSYNGEQFDDLVEDDAHGGGRGSSPGASGADCPSIPKKMTRFSDGKGDNKHHSVYPANAIPHGMSAEELPTKKFRRKKKRGTTIKASTSSQNLSEQGNRGKSFFSAARGSSSGSGDKKGRKGRKGGEAVKKLRKGDVLVHSFYSSTAHHHHENGDGGKPRKKKSGSLIEIDGKSRKKKGGSLIEIDRKSSHDGSTSFFAGVGGGGHHGKKGRKSGSMITVPQVPSTAITMAQLLVQKDGVRSRSFSSELSSTPTSSPRGEPSPNHRLAKAISTRQLLYAPPVKSNSDASSNAAARVGKAASSALGKTLAIHQFRDLSSDITTSSDGDVTPRNPETFGKFAGSGEGVHIPTATSTSSLLHSRTTAESDGSFPAISIHRQGPSDDGDDADAEHPFKTGGPYDGAEGSLLSAANGGGVLGAASGEGSAPGAAAADRGEGSRSPTPARRTSSGGRKRVAKVRSFNDQPNQEVTRAMGSLHRSASDDSMKDHPSRSATFLRTAKLKGTVRGMTVGHRRKASAPDQRAISLDDVRHRPHGSGLGGDDSGSDGAGGVGGVGGVGGGVGGSVAGVGGGSDSARTSQDSMKCFDRKGLLLQKRVGFVPVKDWQAKRLGVVEDMISNEETYVAELGAAAESYLKGIWAHENQLGALTEKRLTLVSIFSQFESLHFKHTDLYFSMLRRKEGYAGGQAWSPGESKIADLFLDETEFIAEQYKRYCGTFKHSVHTIRVLKASFSEIREFLSICEQEVGKSVDDILLMPLRRLPAYTVMLKDLLLHTPNDHPDYTNTVDALVRMSYLVDFVDLSEKAGAELVSAARTQESGLRAHNAALSKMKKPKLKVARMGGAHHKVLEVKMNVDSLAIDITKREHALESKWKCGVDVQVRKCRIDGWLCAVKSVPASDASMLEAEIAVLEALPYHSNIVRYHFSNIGASGMQQVYVGLYDCTLEHYLERRRGAGNALAAQHIVQIALDVLRGLETLHQHRFIARNLCTSAVWGLWGGGPDDPFHAAALAALHGAARADDGTCFRDSPIGAQSIALQRLSPRLSNVPLVPPPPISTPPELWANALPYVDSRYVPPECYYLHQLGYWYEADVWAFGLVLFELLTLMPPYDGKSSRRAAKMQKTGRRPTLTPKAMGLYSSPIISLYEDCTKLEPTERPSLRAIRDRLVEMMAQPVASST